MEKHILELTKNQLRCLSYLLFTSNPCHSGCCYDENEDKDTECRKCQLQQARYELQNMIDEIK